MNDVYLSHPIQSGMFVTKKPATKTCRKPQQNIRHLLKANAVLLCKHRTVCLNTALESRGIKDIER